MLVWDAPVRVFHWLMVLSFAGAYLTAESERWRLLHVTLGYTMAGLVAFRILWGLVGTRQRASRSFVRGPAAVARYLRRAAARPARTPRRPQPGRRAGHRGHAGADAGRRRVAAGRLYNELGGDWLEEVHEGRRQR